MTEAVVGFVVGKLANFMANELKHLGTVGEKVQRMHEELIRIQCCLKDADTKHKGDARVQNWLDELCDVACRIEDATDTFLVEVEDHRQKYPNFLQNINNVFLKTFKVKTLHKLGTDLDNIQNQLKGISKSRVDYGIVPLQDIVGEVVIMPFRRATYQEVDENEVLGMEADKKNILKLLHPKETPRRAVITIVGAGGLEKTTLAHMVYRSARADFEYHIMLSISKQFSLIDLLKKMLPQIEDSVPKNPDVGDLIRKLKTFLNSRRYLIILDDVWTNDLWNQLKYALPDDKNGSRVLITSRSIKVAKLADPKMPPYELYFLNPEKSRDLLLKKAIPYQEPDEECPSDLLELANELSRKCRGLPLALIVLGGILSIKEQNFVAWERVFRTMDLQSDLKGCMDVLAMSYQDMPYYLKACFLYLASFPEGYEISAKHLIRMWVAEGFISCKHTTTKEEMAENYLEELFQSMIQVSSRSIYGLIKTFKVHDLLRDLAMHEARQKNFVTVFSQASNVNQTNREIRRASLQYHELQAQQENPQFMEYFGANSRSLLLFGLGHYTEIQIPKFSNFRPLKVLELVGVKNYDRDLVKEFEKLIHLKYLRFRGCSIILSPISFRHMKTLETLDLRGSVIKEPNFPWVASTLRHVQCDPYELNGPNSTIDLTNLQTMKWVSCQRSWATKLPLLKNLRKLGVTLWENQNWVAITNLLGALPSLVSLGIGVDLGEIVQIPMEIVYLKALPNYQNLQSLYLLGKWSANTTLDANLFPPRLIKLSLGMCNFEQNPMPELGKLKNLKKLSIQKFVINFWDPKIFCLEGFPVLQCLKVNDPYMKELIVLEGVMPMLTYLEVHRYLHLYLPPELQHVTIKNV